MFRLCATVAAMLCFQFTLVAGDLSYLHENNPWYPHTEFPKLTTPQWLGEEGVDAVVVLAIDDMRDTAKYEAYLRPILQRLKQIDGRAPVSIMTCNVKPDDPQLQTWLDEGLSIDVHTIDHPCPILQGGDLAKARSTYDRCVDLLGKIPNNKPVAFRTPCCDSLNTVSPRFFEEIFNRTTDQGNFLSVSSSVFSLYTSADPEIPRDLVTDPDGKERFRKYIPKGMKRNGIPQDNFVNWIENYPYPYVINNLCWEFPCMVPSDWEAQFLQKPNNPKTVEDMKTALDITVLKKGVFNLVFHPHGWIKAEQVVELIDHAVAKHGKKVKFLNFREAHDRLNEHLLAGQALRAKDGGDNGVRILDANNDGFMDVLIGNASVQKTRLWDPTNNQWHDGSLPVSDLTKAKFGTLYDDGRATLMSIGKPVILGKRVSAWTRWNAWMFTEGSWQEDSKGVAAGDTRAVLRQSMPHNSSGHYCRLDSLRDVDGDGLSEAVMLSWSIQNDDQSERLVRIAWPEIGMAPQSIPIPDHYSTRWGDFDGDGDLDILVGEAVYFFEKGKASRGEFKKVMLPKPDHFSPLSALRFDGTDNGFFFHSGHLCWQNEFTADLPDMIHRVSIKKLLQPLKVEQGAVSPLLKPEPDASADAFPLSKSPEESLATIQVAPDLKVELVAAEPLIQDPVAFEWDVQGRLWVVQMGGYPNGTTDADGRPVSGGEIRVLEDQDGDGKYDTSTVFLDDLNFPTGIHRWRNGVIVTDAPTIFYAEDTDGDLKADIRRTLYRGFVEGNQQHRVNGLSWGLDNWLHVANGDSGGEIESVSSLGENQDGGPRDQPSPCDAAEYRDFLSSQMEVSGPGCRIGIRGRDLRIQPDYGLMDPVSGQSQFGRCRDDWGNWFGGNNSRPMWHNMLEDRYTRRNPHFSSGDPRREIFQPPGASPVFPISRTLERFNDHDRANRFTSACSPMLYRDSLLGEEFAGDAFVCEPVHNLVSRRVMTPEGTTFAAQRSANEAGREFLASSDNWFRPVMVRTGPDGAIWIADMYRFVIEHPEWIPEDWQRKLNLQAGRAMGRIYRVVRDVNPACCGSESASEEPSGPGVERDWLTATGSDVSREALLSRLASPNGWWRDTAQRLILHRKDHHFDDMLREMATSHPSPLARLHALCLMIPQLFGGPDVLIPMLSDPNPEIRRHAIRLAEPWLQPSVSKSHEEMADAVLAMANDDDPRVILQLAYSVGSHGPEKSRSAGQVLGKLLVQYQNHPQIFAAAMSSLNVSNMDHVLTEVFRLEKQVDSALVLKLIGQAAAFNRLDSLVDCFGRAVPHESEADGLVFLDRTAALLREVRRHEPTWKKLSDRAEWKSKAVPVLNRGVEQADALLADSSASAESKISAIRFLEVTGAGQPAVSERLASLISPKNSPEVQTAILSALITMADPQTPERLLKQWRTLTPMSRTHVVDALLSRSSWTDELLAALESGSVTDRDLNATHREQLLRSSTESVRKRAAKLFTTETAGTRLEVVSRYEREIGSPGDPLRGRIVFEKRCSACHRLQEIGRSVGADLTALRDRSTSALLTAILDPNRAVEAKFLTYTVVLNSGQVFSGMLASESGNSITLISTEGKEHILLRTEIDQLVSSGRSLMPEGLEKDLSTQDIADVIAFVQTSGQKPKAIPFNNPVNIVADGKGVIELPASAASVFGPNLVVEEHFRNLGQWLSEKDFASWTVVLPEEAAENAFDVEFDFACHRNAAGNQLVLSVAGQAIEGRVPSTNRWDRYSTWRAGKVSLPAGSSRLVVFTRSPPKHALIDIRTIRLIPSAQ